MQPGHAGRLFVVCDGIKGTARRGHRGHAAGDRAGAYDSPDPVHAALRHSKYWDHLARDLRSIYTAPTVEAAWAAFEELEEKWGKPYPAIPKRWRADREQFTPFLAYDV